jgi:hypothetical protein
MRQAPLARTPYRANQGQGAGVSLLLPLTANFTCQSIAKAETAAMACLVSNRCTSNNFFLYRRCKSRAVGKNRQKIIMIQFLFI